MTRRGLFATVLAVFGLGSPRRACLPAGSALFRTGSPGAVYSGGVLTKEMFLRGSAQLKAVGVRRLPVDYGRYHGRWISKRQAVIESGGQK